ncbi:lysophospholipid acyltransferase family protein [Owenweeksia hongkongensis]|uniref:lysophospholipid acyltransferase family protein n=1 Tax=Owenweeksia hongkongensis TaxID=253245 RepID=UPI003A8DE784
MKKILLYPLSVIFYACFIGIMFLFHPLQWLCLKVGGYKAHKISVDLLNLSLMSCLYVIGNRCSYHNTQNLPNDKPLIIVSNHQSMFDIIAISWFMRKHHPKFISKVELGKGWPSVSFNLRHGGSVLIDRQNPRQSIPALTEFSKYIANNKRSAVIFPEGTRSKTGELKPFSTTGLKILFKNIPEAWVVPVTINNSWKLLKYGSFPVNAGINLSLTVQEPIELGTMPEDELLVKIEQRINKDII